MTISACLGTFATDCFNASIPSGLLVGPANWACTICFCRYRKGNATLMTTGRSVFWSCETKSAGVRKFALRPRVGLLGGALNQRTENVAGQADGKKKYSATAHLPPSYAPRSPATTGERVPIDRRN